MVNIDDMDQWSFGGVVVGGGLIGMYYLRGNGQADYIHTFWRQFDQFGCSSDIR